MLVLEKGFFGRVYMELVDWKGAYAIMQEESDFIGHLQSYVE